MFDFSFPVPVRFLEETPQQKHRTYRAWVSKNWRKNRKLNNCALVIEKVDFLIKWVYNNFMRQFDPIVKHILDLFGISWEFSA